MKTVKIKLCYGDHREYVSRHRTEDANAAIDAAIHKHFGKRSQFYKNITLSTKGTLYGQIGHYVEKAGVSVMDTGQVSISVE